jgi:peptidoglycan/xylan/chitin deacetylase (PgdA/CDA1 family)
MSWDEIRALADAGWEIGGHTCSHPRLTTVDDATLEPELMGARSACERELARPCRSIAYPFGDCDARVRDAAAAAGYEAAAGLSSAAFVDRTVLEWPRVGVWHGESDRRFRLKTSSLADRVRRSRLLSEVDGARKRGLRA